jgi:hypothetical protein
MALPPIAKVTLQAALMSAGSNVVAQAITSYREEVRCFTDLVPDILFPISDYGVA